MRKTVRNLLYALCAAAAMLLLPTTDAAARDGGCQIGYCLEERSACVADCGRYGVDEFRCTFGVECSSNCRCQHY